MSVIEGVRKVVKKRSSPDDDDDEEPRVQSAREERVYRYTIASVWFAITLLITLCMPDIGVVVTVLGSVAAAFMFLFPGQCSLII